jgi:hypothetical protein
VIACRQVREETSQALPRLLRLREHLNPLQKAVNGEVVTKPAISAGSARSPARPCCYTQREWTRQTS